MEEQTLWVFRGHKDEEYKGVADFLMFLSKDKIQKIWHTETGYLPITKTAYKTLKREGYYSKEPAQEVAIQQLMRGKTGKNTRGIRLGSFTQIREIINEELEKVWAGRSSVDKGLKSY